MLNVILTWNAGGIQVEVMDCRKGRGGGVEKTPREYETGAF